MRVRWALEELGLPYEVRLLSFSGMKEPEHLALNPFGQIPTLQDGDLTLFESGAIILHLANQHPGLLPEQPNARARAISWMFAALNTVEPPVVEWSMARIVESKEPWFDQRQPMLVERIRNRLAALSARLGDADWLDGAFSAGDLLMVTVLMRLGASDLVEEHANLAAYLARAKARPAFQRAFAAQLAVYQASVAQG
jgi:glutathione S-transferase